MADEPLNDFPGWARALAHQHDQPLRRYAYSLCRNWEAAHDAVQSTWLRLLRARREEVEPRLPAWLFLVCRRQVIDQFRKQGRMDSIDTLSHDSASPDPAPAAVAEQRDAAQAILAQLELLPPAQREALRLKLQGGLSYKEIADVTDRSVNAVGVLIHTGLRTLRDRIRLHSDLLATQEPS